MLGPKQRTPTVGVCSKSVGQGRQFANAVCIITCLWAHHVSKYILRGITTRLAKGCGYSSLDRRTKTTLPSPLFTRSPGLAFFDRKLNSFFAAVGMSMPSCATSSVAGRVDFTSYISGPVPGLTKVCSVRGNLWRFALGCWEMLSELNGRCRRRLRVVGAEFVLAATSVPCCEGENIVSSASVLGEYREQLVWHHRNGRKGVGRGF
jgi:hypothetical protein